MLTAMSPRVNTPSVYYDLVEHEPVPVDFEGWAQACERRTNEITQMGVDPWRVARTEFAGGAVLSTVFLGIDHGWGFVRPPVLFETMLFGSELRDGIPIGDDLGQWRYSTWDQAIEGHAAIAALFDEQANARDDAD